LAAILEIDFVKTSNQLRIKNKTRAERRSLITAKFQAFNNLVNYAI